MRRRPTSLDDDSGPVQSECGTFPLNCLNGGECVKKSWRKSRFAVPTYICRCDSGFKGKQCQYRLVEYSKEPIGRVGVTNLVVIVLLVTLLSLLAGVLLFKCLKKKKKPRDTCMIIQPRKLQKTPPHLTIEIPDEPKVSVRSTDHTRRRSRSRGSKDLSGVGDQLEAADGCISGPKEISQPPITVKLPPPKLRHLSHVEFGQMRGKSLGNKCRLGSLQETFHLH